MPKWKAWQLLDAQDLVPTGVVAELGTVNRERFFLLSDPTNKPLWNAVISPSLDLILEDLPVHILIRYIVIDLEIFREIIPVIYTGIK